MSFTMLMITFVVFLAVFFVMVLVMSLAVRPVMRHIDIVVPFVAHEIDRSSASIIFLTVLAPVLLMPRRYVQINRLFDNVTWHGLNHDGLWVNELRLRSVSNVNAPIKARLADTDRNTDIGSVCWHGEYDHHNDE